MQTCSTFVLPVIHRSGNWTWLFALYLKKGYSLFTTPPLFWNEFRQHSGLQTGQDFFLSRSERGVEVRRMHTRILGAVLPFLGARRIQQKKNVSWHIPESPPTCLQHHSSSLSWAQPTTLLHPFKLACLAQKAFPELGSFLLPALPFLYLFRCLLLCGISLTCTS